MKSVSIITATYNSENEILKTYESIKHQSFTNWNWFITDDCSSDNTREIIDSLREQDSRVHVFKNEVNSGAAVSRNRSISESNDDFVAFIDSDDVWDPDKLRRQLNFMGEHIAFSFTAYNLINEFGEPMNQTVDANHTGAFDYEDMLRKKATLGCSTVMVRRKVFSDLNMPLLRTGQDYATWLKLLRTGEKAYLLNEVLTSYRILPNSISRNKFKKALRQWQIYREVEELPIIKSCVCYSFYVWRALFRK